MWYCGQRRTDKWESLTKPVAPPVANHPAADGLGLQTSRWKATLSGGNVLAGACCCVSPFLGVALPLAGDFLGVAAFVAGAGFSGIAHERTSVSPTLLSELHWITSSFGRYSDCHGCVVRWKVA